jgi:hypothetical protein
MSTDLRASIEALKVHLEDQFEAALRDGRLLMTVAEAQALGCLMELVYQESRGL